MAAHLNQFVVTTVAVLAVAAKMGIHAVLTEVAVAAVITATTVSETRLKLNGTEQQQQQQKNFFKPTLFFKKRVSTRLYRQIKTNKTRTSKKVNQAKRSE